MTTGEATSQGREDDAHIISEWGIDRRLVDGVKVREVRNMLDVPYHYDDRDEWRPPPDAGETPYTFA